MRLYLLLFIILRKNNLSVIHAGREEKRKMKKISVQTFVNANHLLSG